FPLCPAGAKAKAAAVRFGPGPPAAAAAAGHVRFDAALRDSAVAVAQERDGSFLVKVGFLKVAHRYEITFVLPALPRLGRDVCAAPLPGANLRVTRIVPTPQGYSVQCEYLAQREGVLREELLLVSETRDGACVRVVVQARVMG
ncbi:CT027 protein, partial [Crypturellus undulatus]|nr:CT027 protein [Crypturellus undulatus]